MNAKEILVIDDNLYLLEVYKDILTSFGYKVTTRSTGKEAVDFVCQARPNLVILDMTLDGYDGRDICNALKQTRPVQDIPVVMISGNYPLERYISGYCQPDSFLEKPFEIDELVSVIECQLKRVG